MLQYIPIIGGLVEKWLGNRAAREANAHSQQMAIHNQFGAEFRDLANRTWWDSFIDGLNRLPRPVMTFGVIWLFYYAVSNPPGFVEAATALKVVPYEMWVALWMVIGFWFGTKAIEKMPRSFGKLENIDISQANAYLDERNKSFTDHRDMPDPQEGISWDQRVKKRYRHDDPNSYNS